MYKKLLSPGKIGNLELKNRVVMTAMGVGAAAPNGVANDRAATYYEERAKGGVGLIITEVTRINGAHGVAIPGQLGVNADYQIEPLRKMVDRVHSHGTKIMVQLHHPGRQNLQMVATAWPMGMAFAKVFPPFWDVMFKMSGMMDIDLEMMDNPIMVAANRTFMKPVLSASNVECGLGGSFVNKQRTRALKLKEIKELEREYIDGAIRAQKAGCDGVEIHAAHGYLVQQFLSPYTNRRKDEYGGSLDNRMRFLLNIIKGIKEECGKDYPVLVRLTVDEFYDTIGMKGTGIQLPEGVEMAKKLEAAGVDAIDVSCASYETLNCLIEPISKEPGWRSYLAEAVKKAVNIPVISVGVIRTPDQAEKLLKDGNQDFIGLGRPLLADPYWVKKAEEGRADEIQRCISCVSCFESLEVNALGGQPCECALNPRNCREILYNDKTIKKVKRGKTVVVVGAGPAGLTAARECAKRGFKTILLEKNQKAGGQLNLAAQPPHKDKMNWAIQDLEKNALVAGVKIVYGAEATPELIKKYKPYGVIIATGGTSIKPRIPGADGANVCTTTEILTGDIKLKNKKVAVIGSGMTGLETSELLCSQGNQVTVVEMAKKIGPGLWTQHYMDVVPRLEEYGTKFIPGNKLVNITEDSIEIENQKGKKKTIDVDYVVLSLGVRSVNNLVDELKGVCKKVKVVGDANQPGRILGATREGFKAAIEM